MTTLAHDHVRPTRTPRLSGPVWLVWRQHRAAYWTLVGLTLVGVLAMVVLRGQMTDYLNTSAPASGALPPDFEKYSGRLTRVGGCLTYLPVLAGVFLGAPLFAGDLESGTAKLVTSQSVGRLRWLTTKLTLTAALITLSTAALSLTFAWWWSPIKGRDDTLEWTSGVFFDGTGPVPVAYALLTFTLGAAIGLLLRRTLVSMAVTLGVVVALGLVWDRFRLNLGHVLTLSSDQGIGPDAAQPELPAQAIQQGQGTSFLTDSGARLDWTTCLNGTDSDRARTACLESKHVIGYTMDYLPVTQMHTMQWLGTGIMLAGTAAAVLFVVEWGRRRLL
ncbi:ABC transporter permease subunit [Streptomyces sp. NPDC046716]|uniref:ABC transporter permease subunit n=1 Tax=Streptomyces sp. NPDC046716 TaxID=3157093 RepID=UPI0033C9C4A8